MSAASSLVALVAGGASGLGLATVKRLVSAGYRVMVSDLPGSKGQQVVDECGADRVAFVTTDVRDEKSMKAACDAVLDKFGALHLSVNCAGIAVAYKTYNFRKDTPHELLDFERVLNTNTIGAFNVARLSAGLIGKNEPLNEDGWRGTIVLTSSIAAFEGQMGQVAYAASKGAVAAMTLPMARDLASAGIRVVGVAPGLFNTPLLNYLPEKIIRALGELVPHPKRLGHPEEFGQLVLDIANNPMMNGTVVRLDGGLRMTM